ncbi:MAG: hypothetical protein II652_00280 [Bacteroidales bacterium]|nr:hypothetical protein [Bacteroidales bacterium]
MKKTVLTVLLLALSCITGLSQEIFERGFEGKNKVFVPKGSMGIGLSASYSNNGVGDENGFTLLPSHVGELKGSWTSVGFHPSFEYFLKDNWSIGLRFDYLRDIFALDSARLALNDDLAFNISDWNYQRQSFLGAVATRYYVPFLGSRIFGWFVEGRISGGYIQSKNYSVEEDGALHGTYDDQIRIGIGLNPGICFFVAENFDFEVQVGLIDLSMNRINQTENQVRKSSVWRFNAHEKIDLLAIQFGAHVYFQSRKK